eukprot:TRINITY_DN49718_c0_g1_i1.p1 TRINITY_DN49718_c0_g1~~TRINITY_DN49718_c0_g1_i1.p1  ORF type:complete len:920 (-),score=264.55 TRINITY_DN49718_c0_g1_i1:129-2828(-)
MGQGNCCAHTQSSESREPEPPKEDEHAAVIFTDGTMALDRKRGDARKGNKARIGGVIEGEELGEEHLQAHKKAKDMDKASKELIRNAMKQDRVCAILQDTEVEAILSTMEYFEFGKGSLIVAQGEPGSTFFVTHKGTLEVSVNGKVCNTVMEGQAFGGLALLYNCPRTATVRALNDCGVWGANGGNFKKVLQENARQHQADNLKFLGSIRIFDGLNQKQKDAAAGVAFHETFEPGARPASAGEPQTAVYCVKKGELIIMKGGQIKADGKFVDGEEVSRVTPGECIGEEMLYSKEEGVWSNTLLASSRCELLCISVRELKELLGDNLGDVLEKALVRKSLGMCPVMSQFSSTQKAELVKSVVVKELAAGATLEDGLRFVVCLDGKLKGVHKDKEVQLERGQFLEDGGVLDSDAASKAKAEIRNLKAETKSKVGMLTREGLASALKSLGLAAIGSAEDASDVTRKMILANKVHIFRHLSGEQISKLVRSFVLQRYRNGAHVIKQGEVGSSFFVIATGEVSVEIDGKFIRTMTKNSYFGERALLFDEARTATVEVASQEAELWSIEKSTFSQIVKGKMQEDLMHRIRLQDTAFGLKDLKVVKVIGAGAAGVVRLVSNKKTGMRYALKRVQKAGGKIPEEVKRECELLKAQDHPFIMTLVQTFETAKSVYILTELITGGELHGAIREIPTVLSRSQAQFYTGCLLIVLEELSERNIVYRDLKPENVMLDAQGYLKLIDFGIAKKLEEGKSRTFTMIGTPHYMAPEVMRGHGYGTEVDLWSLGVILFEFVCGYLPFADELDDPTEVCTAVLKDPLVFPSRFKDVHGKSLMQGLLNRQPKKRLGAGLNGWDDIRKHEFFRAGHHGSSLFDKIMGRELDPPVVPKGETYCKPEEIDVAFSDDGELG